MSESTKTPGVFTSVQVGEADPIGASRGVIAQMKADGVKFYLRQDNDEFVELFLHTYAGWGAGSKERFYFEVMQKTTTNLPVPPPSSVMPTNDSEQKV